jgi:hypothetical protein
MSDYTREAFERDRFATAGPVQPPATPQEPNRPDLDTVTELWRRQMYPAIDRALFVECFNDRANPGWQVVRDEVSAVRAVLLHFALPSPPTPEGTQP